MSGEKDPDLTVVRTGASRGEVELQLGEPKTTTALEDGAVRCVYAYQLGNTPSAGRAIGHGAMDVVTFGLWEVVGTPIEAVSGDKYELAITYDKDSKVSEIARSKVGKKIDQPQKKKKKERLS